MRNRYIAIAVLTPLFLAAIAIGAGFRESIYGSKLSELTTAVSIRYTNGSERVRIGSIMARADAASNTWTIAVINNSQTNILKTGTLSTTAYTLLYEGNGTVPLGAGGVIQITGTVNTNALLTTNNVQYQIHTLSAD